MRCLRPYCGFVSLSRGVYTPAVVAAAAAVLVPWVYQEHHERDKDSRHSSACEGASTGAPEEIRASSEKRQEIVYRYYRVFTKEELLDLCREERERLQVLDCYYDSNNWCVVLQRI